MYQQKVGTKAKHREIRKQAVEVEEKFITRKANIDIGSAIQCRELSKAMEKPERRKT